MPADEHISTTEAIKILNDALYRVGIPLSAHELVGRVLYYQEMKSIPPHDASFAHLIMCCKVEAVYMSHNTDPVIRTTMGALITQSANAHGYWGLAMPGESVKHWGMIAIG